MSSASGLSPILFVQREEEEEEEQNHSGDQREEGAVVPRRAWRATAAHPVFQPSDLYRGLKVTLSMLTGPLAATMYHLPQFLLKLPSL